MLGFKQMGDRHLDSWHSLPFTNPLHQPPLLHIPILSFLRSHCLFSFLFTALSLAGRSNITKVVIKELICAWDFIRKQIGRRVERNKKIRHILRVLSLTQKQVKVVDSSTSVHDVFVSMCVSVHVI